MNEPDIIDLDEDYMEESTLSDEYDWNQLQMDENDTDDLSYQQEDWITTCY